MQALPSGGAMAVVFASPEQVTGFLHDSAEEIGIAAEEIGIAAYNGPRNVVVSGTGRAVRRLLGKFDVKGIHSKILVTSHAFHSRMMDPMLQPLEEFADSLSSRPPQIQLISNLTGQPADDRTYTDTGYWARHARAPVQFEAGMQALADYGCDVFLEIGPNPVLVGMGQRCLSGDFLRWLPSLRNGQDDWQTLLESLAELYVTGAPVDWTAFDRDYRRQRRELPSYPFQRKRYWAKSAEEKLRSGSGTRLHIGPSLHPLLGHRMAAAVAEQVFESQLTASRPLILADHKIQGVVVMPGAAYLEMALAASTVVHGRAWDVCEATLVEPLLLNQWPTVVQTIIAPQGEDASSFRIVSLNKDEPDQEPSYKTHAVGRLEKPSEKTVAPLDIDAQRARFTGTPFDDAWRTEALRKSGLQPGPSFCWFLFHWLNEQDALGQVRKTRSNDHDAGYLVHPGLLDCAFQLLGAVLPGAGTGIDAYVPMTVERLRLFDRTGDPAWYLVSLTSLERDFATGDVILVDGEGRVLMMVEGLQLRRVPRDWLVHLVAEPRQELTYELVWQEQPAKIDTADESPGDTKIKRTSQLANEPAIWLVFGSQDGLGTALARRLELKSHSCQVVTVHDAESRRTLVREFLSNDSIPVSGIVYLSALDVDGLTDGTAPDFDAARDNGWGGALDVLQAIVGTRIQRPPRLWLVTRVAQPVGETDHGLALAQSPLWGLGRVIASEHPELACTRIDLDYHPRAEEADQLADEICRADREDQIAFREGRRWVPRLHPVQDRKGGELKVPHGQPYRLEIIARGQLDQVELRPISRLSLEPRQVEIEVRATGLNFRDVLNLLNLYPGDPGPLGGECAGEVVAVGAGVEHVKPGDQVVALAPASFASHVITLDKFVVTKPAGLSFQEAATIPIAFLSAYFGLCRLGRMSSQDRVLIHAASGGVGLAAIRLAQQAGAEIFATAGNPRKREYLKSLGIRHVMDSRSLDFAEQIRKVTKGEGVDLVLNSLTGETISSSLSVLRYGGRFLELGKTDLWDQTRVDEFRPGVTFHAIALDQMMAEEAETVHELMQDVMLQFANGRLEPLPLRTFSIRRMVSGLRHMARAEHIGKVVIEAERVEETNRIFRLREGGSYLVTGGLGGLGLKVAGWLTAHGARHLVLAGRSAPSKEAQAALTEIKQAGVQITVRRCDVADRYEVAELLTAIAEELPPLRGIFHLAGVLDDGVLREQTRERFDRVMAAKVLGAWNLHELTENLSLDQFVLFSSAASLMGSPGQANYAAANAFLDALAHHRRAESRPALSVNWGMWSQVGMAARLQDERTNRWSQSGVGSIEPELGLQTLERLLTTDAVQIGVLPIDWTKFFDRIPSGTEPAWLSDLARSNRAVDGTQKSGPPVLFEKLKAALPGERLDLATMFLRQQAARVLAIDEDHLPDPRRKLNELGFDSLTGVEFVNGVGRAIGQEINPALLFDYPTLESLASYVVRDALHLASEAETPPDEPAETGEASREQLAENVKGMSEEEMNTLVSKQLELLQAKGDSEVST
jgi:acyl transferase domain-containing protein/acyl carrier protein